jgi:hypothetical protein
MIERLRPALVVLLLAAAALACNAANLIAPEPAPIVEVVVTAVPSGTSPPATMAVVTPEVTPSPPVVHTLFPGEPPPPVRFMTDRSSAVLAGEHRSIADDFNNGLFERPFTSLAMDYKGFLDLTRGEIASAGLWVYVTLFLEGPPSAAEPASYGVEIDLDLDGRGDWLIVGAAPPSTTWTTDGVRAFQDTNNDVGAQVPVRSDPPAGAGNGYESLVFDQGIGPDPDAAWIRLSPSNPNQVQIAFKPGLIGGDNEFLWWGWAFADPQPAWQDYQDHFTLAQAGSPLSESPQYPIKDLALIDSTCRWGFDFNPVGTEPGVCPVPPTPTPTLTRTPTVTPSPTFAGPF